MGCGVSYADFNNFVYFYYCGKVAVVKPVSKCQMNADRKEAPCGYVSCRNGVNGC